MWLVQLLHKHIRLNIDDIMKARPCVPDSWWSRALWRGKQWRTHRTSGFWSTLASLHRGNYRKEGIRSSSTNEKTTEQSLDTKRKLWNQPKHRCGKTNIFMLSFESGKEVMYSLPAMCVKGREQHNMIRCAYFAVVSSTNRLTMLFSRVLKYCGEKRGPKSKNVTTTDRKLWSSKSTVPVRQLTTNWPD